MKDNLVFFNKDVNICFITFPVFNMTEEKAQKWLNLNLDKIGEYIEQELCNEIDPLEWQFHMAITRFAAEHKKRIESLDTELDKDHMDLWLGLDGDILAGSEFTFELENNQLSK